MTTEPEAQARSRTILHMHLCNDETTIVVDHTYLPEGASGECTEEGCEHAAHDPGMVGLMLGDDSEDGAFVSALLHPGQALILANRLTRAANLVLESEEDLPDVERESARFTAGSEES